ncbi:unnamed protein product [Orchesella dallaii]|uniref:Sodium-dependent nutrient amino acid transporter 1 n=1 Tax=Orchesella dallaii TaxID=48710 RepID=A0ABP1RS26_9HEXA
MACNGSVSEENVPDPNPIKSDQTFDLSIQEGQEENIPERPEWSNRREFLLSCISMSVGLGNVWRFPVTAYENGGGAFLIPYLTVVFLIGRPLYFLELCLGQFSSDTQIGIWRMAPLFKGVGITSMISLVSVLTYYVYIMALSLHYLFTSIYSLTTSNQKLPWTELEYGYNYNGSLTDNNNMSLPEMYFKYEVVKEADSIVNMSDIGFPDWKLSLCLIICWLIVFVCLIRGVKSSGKVAHVTAIVPYIGMSILVAHGLTLKGGLDGIYYFITPRWEKLLEPKVWFEATTQSFFSLNIGFGSSIMFGSRNKIDLNLYQSSYIITVVDTCTSLLAGCTIFATLGNLAVERGTDVSQVVSGGGAGLVFITYADALAKFQWCPQIFSMIFFLMLFILGLGSVNSCVGTVVSILQDSFPKRMGWKMLLSGVSVGGCACGMMYTTPGGLWLMELVSFYSSSFVVFTSTILFLVGVTWVYGVNNVFDDVEFMLGTRPSMFTKICLKFIIPAVMIIILSCLIIEGMAPTYMDREYPLFALAFGCTISAFALVMLPVAAIHSMQQLKGPSLKEKFFQSLNPTASWGPRNPQNMEKWKEFTKDRDRSMYG